MPFVPTVEERQLRVAGLASCRRPSGRRAWGRERHCAERPPLGMRSTGKSPARVTCVTITPVAPLSSHPSRSRRSASRPRRGPSDADALPLLVSALAIVTACRGSLVTETADAGQRSSNAASGEDASTTGTSRAKCGSTPTTFITAKDLFLRVSGGISAAMDLAVNATDLYVAINSSPDAIILRAPLGGGSISMVAAVEGNEQSLVLTDDYVVFAESHTAPNSRSAGEIVRVGLDGSNRTVLFSGSISASTVFGPAGI